MTVFHTALDAALEEDLRQTIIAVYSLTEEQLERLAEAVSMLDREIREAWDRLEQHQATCGQRCGQPVDNHP